MLLQIWIGVTVILNAGVAYQQFAAHQPAILHTPLHVYPTFSTPTVLWYLPRSASNNSFDFLLFVTTLVSSGNLIAGNVLVLDNAPVHYSADIAPPLDLLLATAGVRMLFLPTYSPELNPCEHIFAQIKRHLRLHRSTQSLLVDIFTACASVSMHNVLAYYNKCIHHPCE